MITSCFARALSLLPRLLAVTLFHGACVSAGLQAQAIVHEFFVPMPEAQMRTALATIEPGSGVVGTSISSVISVVVAVQGTKVVCDHWEDGYEMDLNNPLQATTQIWGDGNNANGKPPGYLNDPVGFARGAVLALENVVTLPRNPAQLRYDGRDVIGATQPIVVTRTGWPLAPGPMLGGSIEVTPTLDYGTSYVSPVGTDVSANQMFEYAGLFIMARDNGTSVTIDVDGAGPAAAVTVPLNRGESHLINNGVKKGATVTATKPVQVDLVTGDIGGRFETNWMTLFPVNQWTTTYYSPVGTAANGHPAVAYLYNNQAAPLTVTATSNLGAVSFAIPAKGVYAYTIPKLSGLQLTAASPFFGIVMVGADPSNTSAHDWGFTLVPGDSLTSELVCGWGPGSVDLTANGSPVWVTPSADTRLYVDFNGDGLGALTDPKGGKYDQHFDLSALASRTLYDPDLNQTAMRVYTMNGARLAGAWGQDPAVAGTGNPYLDVGTGLLPFPIPQLEKSYRIFQDNGAPGLSLLDVLEYTIRIDNRGLVSLGNIPVVDALPSGISYVAGSSARDGIALLDNGSGTPFPLDAPGYNIPSLLRRGSTVFTYRATITSTGQISNTVTSTSLGLTGNAVVNVAGVGTLAPVIQFTDGSGAVQATYPAGGGIYVTLTDAGANLNSGAADTVSVLVRNTTSGDLEFVLLTETGPATGVFRNTAALASSSTAGSVEQDGTLYAEAGDALAVAYTDALYGLSASAAAQIATPTLIKQLYLHSDGADNDASGYLNRNDPVSLGLTTTAATQALQAAATPVLATIEQNAAPASATVSNVASYSFAYNAGPATDANRVLLVGVTFRKGNGGANRTVSSVTYAGVAMTPVGSANNNKHQRAYLYALVNPPAGTGSTQVAITWSAALANGAVVGAVCYKGVDPLLNSAVTATDDSDPALTVPTAAGSLVVGVAGGRTATAGGYSVSSPGSALWSRVAVSGESVGSAQTQPGVNGAVNLSWTAANAQWAAVGLSLNPAHLRVPVVGQPQSYLTGDVSSSTNAYDSGSTGSNRLLLVGITYRNATSGNGNDAADEQVSSVTYGGDALTQLGAVNNPGNSRVYLYYRLSPKTGSNSLVVNWDSPLDRSAVVGAVTFANVDPTTPFGTLQSATGDSTAPAVTGVASAASDRVFGLVGGRSNSYYNFVPGGSVNAGTAWSEVAEADHSVGHAQSKPGVDGTVGFQWSGTNDPWAALGVAIKPAPSAGGGAGGTVTFTQTPDFQKDFILPLGGTVSVVTHVNVTSGTLPANPAVEAVLAHDGTPFATLSSPVYNSGAGTLTWTGTLAAALTVPAGEAIDLTLTSSESAAFKVEYGSQSRPSLINLPTTTVIAIDSLGVYDAPYPGGTPVSSGINGTNLYVRVQVSDPFGAYDVTSVDLNLDGPGSAGDVSATLGQAQVVASAGAVKTYEYVWSTNLTEGGFNVAATAHEGTEGTITATTALALSLSTMDGGGTPATAQFTATANGLSTSLYPVDTTLHLRVTDLDQNLNGGVAETLTVTVVAGAGDQETVTLTETGPNTGIFVGSLAASGTVGGGNGNGTLLAPVGTALNLSYVDPTDASDTAAATALVTAAGGPVIGNSVTVTKLLLNRPSSRARVGETVQYRVLVVNNGTNPLSSVAVTDTYPADKLQFNLASVAPSAAVPGTLTWANVGPLAPGASATLDLDFTALASAAPATNAVLADAGSGVTASTSVGVTLVDPKVTVSKTVVTPVPPATAQIGDVVTFSINVTNSGDTAITTLPLEDSYSGASFELVSASVPPDSSGYGSLLWNDLTGAGSLAPGASLSVDVLLRVKGAADPASNVATADFAQDEYGYTLSAATSTASLTLLAAKISGTVYDDLDQSGGFTAGDVGLEGVAVRLFTDPNGDGNPADGVQIRYAETGIDGGYEFVDLAVGKYVIVKSSALPGYVNSSPTQLPIEITGLTSYPGNHFFDYFDNGPSPGAQAQTICFRAPAAASRHEVLPLTAATATSGLRVQFSVVSGPATVAGNLVSFTGTGAVVVRASQPGDAIYQAAPTVDQTIQALDISIPTGVQAGWRATHAEGAANATAMAVAVELNDPTGAPGSAATHVAVAGYVTNASGNRDLYVARYNAVTGAQIWSQTYVGAANGDDEANAVAVDSQGNVIVAGEVARAAGNSDILVAKYAAADGTQLWVQTYAGDGAADYGEDGLAHYDYYDAPGRQPLGRRNLAVGADGSVVVGGYVTNVAGNLDLVVLKYGSAGNFVWRGDYDLGIGNDYAHAVAVDSAGNVYATGGSNGTTLDAVTVKFDAAGTRLWAQRYDNGKPDKMLTLLLDKDEHPVVGGYTQEGTFNMVSVRYNKAGDGAGGTTILWEGRVDHPVNRSSDNVWDMSLVQGNDVILTGAGYASAGAFNGYTLRFPDQCATVLRWGVDYNGPANKQDQMVAMGADVFGNPVVTGYSQNADGSYDIYTAKYRAEDGSFLWAQRLDGAAGLSDEPTAVAVDPSGNVFVAGYTTVAGGTTELLVQSYRAYDDPARQAQTITFANPGAQQAGTPLTLAATSSSGLPVQLSVIDGPAVLNGNLLTFTGIGSVTVRAWQPGSGDYLAAVPVDQTFTVSKSPQTIHFALPATIYRVNGAWEPWPLTAVATSGLPVNYTVTAGTATINSGVLTLGAAGAVTVQASQAGDHRFLAAANVTATVTGVDLGTIVIPNTLTLNWRDRSLLDPALPGSIANGEGNALALHEAPAGHADSAYVAGFVLAANGKKDLLLTRYNQLYLPGAPPVDTGVGQQVWTRTLNGAADGDDEALAVAVASNGDVAVAGYRTTAANGRDLHVAKFNAAGDLQWQYTYNGTANSTDTAVAVAFEGTTNVVVGGYVTNTGTGRDFFAAKLDIATGLPLDLGGGDTWVRSANRAASHPDTPVEMVVGTDGGVVLAGGSGPLLSSYASQSDYTFAVKFAAADGALAWSRAYSYSASSPDTLTGLALDSANNVIVSGYSRRANYDIYTAKYAANTGALIWENYFNGGSSDATWDVAVDRSGNAFVAGHSYPSAGVKDGITLKLNGLTGAEIWNRKPYGTGLVGANDENFTVNLDVLGNAVVTGYTTLPDATKDVYLSKNNSATGAILNESGFDGYYGRDDSIKQVKVDPKGNVWMTGFTTDTTGQRKILVVRLFP